MGWSNRWSSESVSPSAEPFEHSRPKLAGCAGSPEIVALPCRSTAARMPQPTPQYGQVVRTAGGCDDKMFMTGSCSTQLFRRADAVLGRLPLCQSPTENEVLADRLDRGAGT